MNVSATQGVFGKAVNKIGQLLGAKGLGTRSTEKAAAKMVKKTRADQLAFAKGAKNGEKMKTLDNVKKGTTAVLEDMQASGVKSTKGGKIGGALENTAASNLVTSETALTKEAYESAMSSAEGRLKRNSSFEAAKGYFSEPYNALKNADLTEAERKLAGQQLTARVGATATAGALGVGVTHDLFSNNENDTGIGGITVNTAAAGGLATAAAAGVSMLAKL